jgi:hypothetical protein
MKWHEIVPVIVSVSVILLVAFLEKQSKLIAAVTATMPLTIPLALWIVYSSSQGDKAAVVQFTQSLVFGIIPTVAFAVAAWLAARAGLKLGAIIVVGYATWGVVLLVVMSIKRALGI